MPGRDRAWRECMAYQKALQNILDLQAEWYLQMINFLNNNKLERTSVVMDYLTTALGYNDSTGIRPVWAGCDLEMM